MEQFPNYEYISQLKELCRNIIQNPRNIESMKSLNDLIIHSSKSLIKVVQPTILSTFYPIIKSISENKSSFSDNNKQLIIDTLRNLFDKSTTDKLGLFFNIYAFLLFEIYDHVQHKVLPIHEEYKLSIIECTKSLARSVSTDIIFELYSKTNAPKLCQMLYVSIEVAKTEKLKSLRIAAMECIMSLARVLDNDDFNDVVLRKQVAEVFLFFLPGVASGLKHVALEDEKVGHKIPMVALKAWGRIVTLLMQDYDAVDKNFRISDINVEKINECTQAKVKQKWKTKQDIKEHLEGTKLSPQWYRDTDRKLEILIVDFMRVTRHSHPKVRLELSRMCGIILENCKGTMPNSARHLIEIVITLTEDEDTEISKESTSILRILSDQLNSNDIKCLLESLEEGFLSAINCLPRKFNGIDEREQLTSLNTLIGYFTVFGEHKLSQVLLSANHLNNLMRTLLHISELKRSTVGLLDEYSVKELDPKSDVGTPWKTFIHFNEHSVQMKLEKICALQAKYGSFRIISDFLLDVIMYEEEHRKEGIFILNEAIAGAEVNQENLDIMRNVVDTYIDSSYWQVPLTVGLDECGNDVSLVQTQHNVIQVCLLVEGVGKVASVLKDRFQEFILKTLYLVLERAGSSHSLVRAAGVSALKTISTSCGYSEVTEMINANVDFFSFQVERKLIRAEDKENVLNVLTIVLKYSTMDVLKYIAGIIQEVLVQSCDKFKEQNCIAYLQVFKVFVQCLTEWLQIEVKEEPIKSKAEKLKEVEDFTVSGVNKNVENNFSDAIMEKTAEEMFKEDMVKKKEELENEVGEPEDDEYKKPDPPLHIKLTVAILTRSLHFLPSKDKQKKLLVLQILSSGLEIIRDWEDELLPIVHQIWSPLVQRFKEFNEPLIINYSFQLLVRLARLSKEFIRSRTTKEVIPSILEVLTKLSGESYLKDRGSAYRYSQAFKLQQVLIDNLGKVLINLDTDATTVNKVFECMFKYLSDKQPVPLQVAALEFFKVSAVYDPSNVLNKLGQWENDNKNNEYEKNILQLLTVIQ
nr:TELO2-interacting protein 1 homolog [Leptinotarsa decemlineata]XP_023014504.1 TELO2-interacting protein 1 homolog [Leptinotarsa decemlineata]XP_023014505.1 TELO2-interacting protein 1 homolog [Leptinotarsa decemlineata]XP_023014506.1 TELO2-interacting protein 1 homolog [Leptinotarsa decemlineata]